jgi:(4S)-4-hydroxy-5-phosphonooxypentane-2,3-dione isomerase
MSIVLIATWVAEPGHEDDIARIIATMTPLSPAEPGCEAYQAHRSVDDPRTFLLYERYADEAAAEAHRTSEHFKTHVEGEALDMLERRDRAFYAPLGD